jgi:RNA polymerase sigma-70 factor (ECF subfamily)
MTEFASEVTVQIAAARRAGTAAELLDSYRNYLRLLAQTWLDASLRGKYDRSDLIQETLIKANDRFDQFAGRTEGELVAWLRQILARQLADAARRFHGATRDVARESPVAQFLDASSCSLGRLLPAREPSPSESAQRREMSVLLADALAEMKDEYRDVIVLRNLQELSWPEIGERMGKSQGAVRMLWTRALKELRPLIEKKMR